MALYTPGVTFEEFIAIGPTVRTCVTELNVAIFECDPPTCSNICNLNIESAHQTLAPIPILLQWPMLECANV